MLPLPRRARGRKRLVAKSTSGKSRTCAIDLLSFQTEGADQVVDVRASQLEPVGCLHHVPAGVLERAAHKLSLEAPGRLLKREALALAGGGARRALGEDVLALDLSRSLTGGAE